MSFQRKAIGAQCIFPGLSAIWQEFPKSMGTDRTLYLISPIKQCYDLQKKMAYQLKILARNIADDKTND